jgi:hypothetical protein
LSLFAPNQKVKNRIMEKITLNTKRCTLLVFFLAVSGIGFSQSPQTFNSSGTFNVPAGVTTIQVEAWGAGGKGSTRTSNGGGGGGGGGGYSRKLVTVTPSTAITVVVGVGNGTTGGGLSAGTADSYVINPSTILANGGSGVSNNSSVGGSGGPIGVGDVTYTGGDGANGTGSRGGGGGSSAGTSSNGDDGTNASGGNAPAGGGDGGNGRSGSQGDGSNGSSPGGGGGGAYRSSFGTRDGGDGANGRIIISWGPEINILGNGFSIADNDTTPSTADNTDFGTTGVTSGTIVQTFTIQNLGFGTLTLTPPVSITGTNAGDFTVTAAPGSNSIAANGGQTWFQITFNPSAAGVRNATVTITNSDSNEGTYSFAIRGTGEPAEVAVSGLGNNINDGDATPSTTDGTNFGGMTVAGTMSVVRTFVIENTGGEDLTISTPTLTGSGDFAITSMPAATVPAGGSTTIEITFDPTSSGVKNATLSFANNDSNENPFSFSITGTGTDAEINVRGNSTNIASGDATPSTADHTDFGSTNTATGTVVRTFTIQNVAGSTGTLSIGAVTISGPDAADFTVTANPAATVAAGSSTTFQVTFNPSAMGVRDAVISIANNDSDEDPYTFAVTGFGTDVEIDVTGNGISIAHGDNTPSTADNTNFGTTDVLAGTVSQVFVIHNDASANANLTIGTISFFGGASGDFSVTSAPAASVAPGSSTSLTVTFNPSAAGIRNTNMAIANNDGNESSYTFLLSGTGLDAEMNVQGNGVSIADGDTTASASDHTDFGSAATVNSTIVRTFTIFNSGAATMDLSLGAITITGTNAGDFSFTAPLVALLAPGTSTTFTVTFDPSATGTRTATVNIANNDSNESPYNFAISGVGNSPEINITGNSVSIADGDTTPSVSDATDFGTVSIESGNTLVTFTIQNTGIGNLNIYGVTLSGSNPGDYSVTIAPASVVAAGSSTTFQLSFDPTTIGIKNATVMVTCDDANEDYYTFDITGLGVRTYPDTDGDNISDNIDIDDDNDGIIDASEQNNCVGLPLSSSSNVVFLNETFGTGTTKGLININVPGATCNYCYEDGVVGPNTAQCPSQSSAILDDGEYVVVHRIANTTYGHPDNIHYDLAWNGYEDHTVGDTFGRMAVFNASYDPGIFYETTVSGIIPNVPITYSFWAMNILSQGVGGIRPNITVQFLDMSNNVLSTYNTGDIGRCLASVSSDACPFSEWHQYTTSANLGSNTTFKIRFINNAPGGGGNDLAIDDIMIQQQYCDRDGDGISNIFDLDSDNDGIPDIEEAGFASLSGGRGIMNLAAGTWLDANGNGLHDTIDAMIAGGTYVLPDSDGDGVNNVIDLDSDNDSIFDVDESGLLNGDGDIDGDGFGDGADTDLDGFLDLFDTYIGQGTAVRAFAANAGGTGDPDYMSVDSNSDGIFDIAATLFASLDANNNGQIDGTADVDHDGIRDAYDNATGALGSPRDLNRKLHIDFDGRNDYAQSTQMLSGLPQATIMAWVKMTSPYTSTGFVVGQENFNLKVDAGTGVKVTTTANGQTITYNTNLSVNRWYHIAAVYDGSNATEKLRLYLNGNQMVISNNGALAGTLAASTANLTMGKNPLANNQFFKGSIEEVRVFNAALTTDQVQKMVYQEIRQNGAAVRGEVVPKDVESSAWSSLLAYYRMDAYKDDVIDNYTTGTIDQGANPSFARIYNVKQIRNQLAPLPFVTTQAGSITAAVSQGNFVFGQDVLSNAHSIVQIKHDINLNVNMENLGCFIDPSVNLILNNNNQLRNNWYLKLDGRIDLQGRSQLVQSATSDLDPTSAGYIERDQQGTTNRFNYNYWSSPVGAINATTNNNNYTVAGVMKDGTNAASPQNILWTTGLNSSSTSPITLSSYWIFKFQNVSDSYANWSSVGPNGSLLPGQGYTLKGSNAAAASQNYVFVGKPNNGTITSPIAANNLNLSGNPYPSALDANQFIQDNTAALNGTLYFWEHFGTNATHNLADYQGGYAARTLVGGTPPVSPSEVSGLGSSSRIPGRFIPVGQGFFVTGSATGGTITFNNGQRAFVRETDANSSLMFRQVPNAGIESYETGYNNDEDQYEEDTYAKIRLGFNSANNYHRQILLGFMDDKATPGYDVGYDAKHIDAQPNDFYFVNGYDKLNIAGDDYFSTADIFPLGVKVAQAGTVSFIVDETQYFDEDQDIFIYDKVTGLYHDVKGQKFEIEMPSGTVDNRFELRFSDGSLGTDDLALENNIFVTYTNGLDVIKIKNNLTDATAEGVMLFNMVGQQIAKWDTANEDQSAIELPVRNLATGTYIVKIKTNKGDVGKKIVIR